MKKLKISFVWDWPSYDPQTFTWRDGLAAAVKLLSQRYDVQFLTCSMNDRDYTIFHPYFQIHVSTDIRRDVMAFNPNVVLMWGDCTRPNAKTVAELGKPIALCFAGGDPAGETYQYFDHFFVESGVYKEKFEVLGRSVSTAFGTNTELFKPIPKQQKVFDVCFPATYAGWKRHHIYAEATKGLLSVTAGHVIQDEDPIIGWVQDSGSVAFPHVSPETLQTIYASSKTCCVTSFWTGGSQRTVLEAMAMNVPVIAMKDSDKTSEYVYEAGEGLVVDPDPIQIRVAIEQLKNTKVNTREYILGKWSEHHYADSLEQGLLSILK